MKHRKQEEECYKVGEIRKEHELLILVFVHSWEERCKLKCRIFFNIRKFEIAFPFKADFPEKVCFSLQDIMYTNILLR